MAVVQPAVNKIMHYDIALWQSKADAHTIVSLRFMETHLITETAAYRDIIFSDLLYYVHYHTCSEVRYQDKCIIIQMRYI